MDYSISSGADIRLTGTPLRVTWYLLIWSDLLTWIDSKMSDVYH